jgi:hypothetical protein
VTKKDMANLLLKAFSIYSFLMALQNVPYLINDLSSLQNPVLPIVLQIITPTFTMLLAGILLWFTSGHGEKLIFGNENADAPVQASIQDIQVLAFSLGGLYLIARAIPDLIQNTLIYAWVFFQKTEAENMGSAMLFSFTNLCIGAWLLFGAKGIIVFIKKIRKDSQFRGSH